MATVTVRPFTSPCHNHVAFQRTRPTRVVMPPVASGRGFGEPKKEQTKQQDDLQAQEAAPSTSSPSPYAAPPPASVRQARANMATSPVVGDRILRRIAVCVGVPVFTGLLLFPAFYFLRVVLDVDYPLWIVYVAQLVTFGSGLLGITYGALSASWDPSREGTVMGWSELQANIAFILSNRDKKQD